MHCFIYLRKSTEDKNRQVQSINDQKKIMTDIAKTRGLIVKEIFIDEKSAGKPYQRLGFQEMIKKIHAREASIILSWKIDRLSRNPVENGQISWLLQNNIISEIITAERSYLPQDNVLLYMVESAMANQFLRDLSKNVKRGMYSRAEKGVYPGCVPLGYLNQGHQRGNKTIIPDLKYFPLIKKLWELLLTGNYQLADLYRLMQEKYPLLKKGKPIAFSTFHRIFHNPFYCGLFKWGNKIYLGTHEKMLTQSQFERVQALLNKKEKTRERVLEFDYKGIFKCGCCEAQITAERKTKFIIKTQQEKSFDYYRCVHRKRDIECHEKPLSKKLIESQLAKEIGKLFLPDNVIDFGIDRLGEKKGKETQLQATTSSNIKREIQTLTQQKNQLEDNLVLEGDTEIRSMMKRKHEEIKINIQKLNEDYRKLQKEIADNNLKIIKALEVIKNAKIALEFGTIKEKRTLLNHLGSNWSIKDKKIDYKPNFVIKALLKTNDSIRSKKSLSEPTKSRSATGKTIDNESVSSMWYTLWEFIKNSNGE